MVKVDVTIDSKVKVRVSKVNLDSVVSITHALLGDPNGNAILVVS